jgi:phosphopentomutase
MKLLELDIPITTFKKDSTTNKCVGLIERKDAYSFLTHALAKSKSKNRDRISKGTYIRLKIDFQMDTDGHTEKYAQVYVYDCESFDRDVCYTVEVLQEGDAQIIMSEHSFNILYETVKLTRSEKIQPTH